MPLFHKVQAQCNGRLKRSFRSIAELVHVQSFPLAMSAWLRGQSHFKILAARQSSATRSSDMRSLVCERNRRYCAPNKVAQQYVE
eukprot:4221055-Amphidinium_carterae.1